MSQKGKNSMQEPESFKPVLVPSTNSCGLHWCGRPKSQSPFAASGEPRVGTSRRWALRSLSRSAWAIAPFSRIIPQRAHSHSQSLEMDRHQQMWDPQFKTLIVCIDTHSDRVFTCKKSDHFSGSQLTKIWHRTGFESKELESAYSYQSCKYRWILLETSVEVGRREGGKGRAVPPKKRP